MQQLVDLDYEQSVVRLVCVAEGDHESIIGMTRYDVDPAGRLADIAFVVRDEWQNKGIGTLMIMMKRMTEIARNRGLEGFTAGVLTDNRPMLRVFEKSGLRVRVERDDDSYHLVATF